MKYLLLLTFMGCGLTDELSDKCSGNLCELVLGKTNKAQDLKTDDLEKRLSTLEKNVLQQKADLDNALVGINGLSNQIVNLQNQLNTLNSTQYADTINITNQLVMLRGELNTFEVAVNSQLVYLTNNFLSISNQVSTLDSQTQNSVTEIIDPCGNNPNIYDEVIMKTRNGKFYAYFENGNKRYLSLLPPGSYVTTDGSSCYFTISSSGGLTW